MKLSGETISTRQWTLTQKMIFRFCCIFFILNIIPFPVANIPFANKFWNYPISDAYDAFWHKVIPWVGAHVLHLSTPITIFSNGSSDTTYDYVLLFTFFVLSVIAAAVWSITDRRRSNYAVACIWVTALIRYFLAYSLISYGFAKMFYVQMPAPRLFELIQPMGDKSPMGLAWSYVGYSHAFSVITGTAEFAGGMLLLFRRTVVLGSLLNIFVLGNVVIMNFCFDVPVKLYSSLLWLMSLFVLAPYMKRLMGLLLNKAVEPVVEVWPAKWKLTGWVIKWAFFLCLIWNGITYRLHVQQLVGINRPKPPLYGIYNVTTYVRNNDTIPLVVTDSVPWRNFILEFKGNAVIKYTNDSMQRLVFSIDTNAHTFNMYPFLPKMDTTARSDFHYTEHNDVLELHGRSLGDSVDVYLRRGDPGNFRLISRGFHWINETPYHY